MDEIKTKRSLDWRLVIACIFGIALMIDQYLKGLCSLKMTVVAITLAVISVLLNWLGSDDIEAYAKARLEYENRKEKQLICER